MEIPNVVHPKRIDINGYYFEVVAYEAMSDEEAASVALAFYRTHKLMKKDKGKVIRVLVPFDPGSVMPR